MRMKWYMLVSRYYKLKERLTMWIAWHLPDELVTWCYSRVVAYATTGKFRNTAMPDLTAVDALNSWIYKE